MSPTSIRAVVGKDLPAVTRTRGVRLPLVATPVLLLVVVPVVLVLGGDLLGGSVPVGGTTTPFDDFLPSAQQQAGAQSLSWERTVLEFLMAPFYLLVPLVVATVIASDSFAGERERGTLESLLLTPTSDAELFVGKLAVAWLPATTVGLAGFVVYSALANVLGYAAVGHVFFPTPMWLVLALWVTPAVTALGLVLIVTVSSRVTSLQAAHQIGSLIILPFVLVVVAQVTGGTLMDVRTVVLLGAVIWVLAAGGLVLGVRLFDRDRLASSL